MDPTGFGTQNGERRTVRLVRSAEAILESSPAAAHNMGVRRLPRRCFVTTGSIASFRLLLEEVLSEHFLQALVTQGFDSLEVQCGPDLAWFEAQVNQLRQRQQLPIEIAAVSWAADIRDKMLLCRSEENVRNAGVVIGHAGSGTIMEALRYECPLIIVPNPTLLNNHQLEIAAQIASQDLAVVGQLGHLDAALRLSRLQTQKRNLEALPPYRDPPFPVPGHDRKTLLDRTLLTCYPDELARQTRHYAPPTPSNASMDVTIDSLDAYDRDVALRCMRVG